MRLYDRVNTIYQLPEMPVIDGSAIARQIDQLPDLPPDTNMPPSFYGRIAPPFREFWVEATTYLRDTGMIQRACWFQVMEQDLADWVVREAVSQHITEEIPAERFKWGMTMMGFQYQVQTGIVVCLGNLFIWVDEQGKLLSKSGMVHVNGKPFPIQEKTALLGAALVPATHATEYVPFGLKTISALHDKARAERIVPSRQERRAHERKHPRPLTEYYVLKVKDVTITTFADAKHIGKAPDKEASQHRRHGVHGHFRHYGAKGLFGNPILAYRTVWIPDHERGDDSLGTIKKDYEV